MQNEESKTVEPNNKDGRIDLIKLRPEHFNFLKLFGQVDGDVYSLPFKLKLYKETHDGVGYFEFIPLNEK